MTAARRRISRRRRTMAVGSTARPSRHMRTPGADRDLAGFLLAEDVVRSSDELLAIELCEDTTEEARGNTLNVTVGGEAIARLTTRLDERRQVMMTSSCGLCGRRTIETLRSRVAAVNGQWTVPRICSDPAGDARERSVSSRRPAVSTPRESSSAGRVQQRPRTSASRGRWQDHGPGCGGTLPLDDSLRWSRRSHSAGAESPARRYPSSPPCPRPRASRSSSRANRA